MNATQSALRQTIRIGLAAGTLGWAVLIVGLVVAAERAWFAYLAAYVYTVTLALGALCMVMIAHASNARWFVVIRRPAETAAATFPVLALLFIPLLFGLDRLYPWVRPLSMLEPRVAEVVHHSRAYLNVPFFVGRAVLYFAIWCGLALYLRNWSLREDIDAVSAPRGRVAAVSGAGLMAFAFSETFASFDWIMSLSPAWKSTVFGVYVFSGAMVGGLALITLIVRGLQRTGALTPEVTPAHYYALGRLLLVFTIFWAYIFYAQGFIIWISNLPSEITWYLERWHHGWNVVVYVLFIGQFFIPFLMLLSRPLKHRPGPMVAVGIWILVMHYIDVFWMIIPALHPSGFHWLDLPALIAVLGPTVACGAWLLQGHALLPRGDPLFAQSVAYESP